MPGFMDLTGQRYGRLTVLQRDGHIHGKTAWICRCDCGKIVRKDANAMRQGYSLSCGCMRRELAAIRHTTHDHCGTRLYNIYHDMKARCYRKTCPKYSTYGARGIKICDEWLNDFTTFYDWAIANGYKENLTIDRIDNNGNYEPGNCRWVTNKVQSLNRRSNHILECQGQKKTISEWCEITGLSYSTISARVGKLQWSAEKALTTPLLRRKKA